MFLGYLGWVDLSLLYVNPTYLYSAIVGGVIMGFGFILGGYCPGTSFVGAVIGKVDAMVFIVGSLIGIFIFGHFYSTFEPVYTGNFLGHIHIYDSLGISKSWFAFMLVIVALIAFMLTQMIEDRVNDLSAETIATRPSYRLPTLLLIAAVFIFLFLPEERKSRMSEVSAEILHDEVYGSDAYVSVQRVIYQVKNQDEKLILIDTRSPKEYGHFSLPGAINMTAQEVLNRGWRNLFRKDHRMKVFFGNGNSEATKAYITARRSGYDNVFIMEGGLNKMFHELFVDIKDDRISSTNLQERSTARFMRDARIFFLKGGIAPRETEERRMIEAPEQHEVIPVIGGC